MRTGHSTPVYITDQDHAKFTFNDLRFWAWAFDQFIGDVRDLIPNFGDNDELPTQFDLDQLDIMIAQEFEKDLEHQQYWWMYYDRAAEAIPLLESDGPENYEYPLNGALTREGYDTIREKNSEEAYINLVASNVDRKMGSLSGVKPSFYAEAVNAKDSQAIRALNYWVEDIKDNVNMDLIYNRYKYDGVAFGSGVMRFGHGVDMSNPDFALFRNLVENRQFLTPEEMEKYQRAFDYHQVEYIPTFHCIRYRGAGGAKSMSFTEPIHRQAHYIENISTAEARMRYPDFAGKIHSGIAESAYRVSPYLALVEDDLDDMVTVYHHRVKFPVVESIDVSVGYPGQDSYDTINKEKPRYAVGYITRVHNTGIVDMDLDPFNHNQMDLVQWVSYPSTKHGCGIGMVKFGRDPQIVHNKLHNGMLRYFGRQIKGGGFYIDGVVSDDDLKDLSKGNRWVKVDRSKLPWNMRNAKLSDLIIDNRPPAFPASYASLMQIEEEATDRSMRSTDAWKGMTAGYSGVQQQLASQDSGMMHTNTTDILQFNAKEMGVILLNNVVQFDGERTIEFSRENENGDREQFALNQADFYYQEWDPSAEGGYRFVANRILNDIGSLQFAVKVHARNIVPDKPVEKTNFFIQMLQFIDQYIQTPHGRILLRNFHNEGMRIPGLDRSLDQMDELEKQQRTVQAQLAERAEEYERLKDRREFAKDKAEIDQNLLRLMQKFVADLAKANPETLRMIFSGNYPALQQDLTQAIDQLTGTNPQQPNIPNMGGSPFGGGGAGGGQQGPTPQQLQQLQQLTQNQ